MRLLQSSSALATLAALGLPVASMACSGSQGDAPSGQSDFVSAPAGGAGGNHGAGGFGGGASAGTAAPGASLAPAPPKGGGTSKTPGRTVQETDLYRLEGTRLYYLNSYRGLMVFDVTNVDQPRLLGRSAIFGSPVDMVVKSGIATVVVGDWYGTLDSGAPFHGSIVRGLDATDPTNIKVLGEAKLGGWVQEDRVVGNVLYAVSEDQGWIYDWGYPGPVFAGGGGGVAVGVSSPAGGANGPSVIVSSVDFSGGQVKQVSSKTYAGYGGVFNVTPNAIMLAHPDVPPAADGGPYVSPTQTDLQYLDITDPGGQIVERGTLKVSGTIDSYGADSGRWNLDFADGVTAHVIATAPSQGGASSTSYILSTANFSNPDQPTLASALAVPSPGWSAVARFDSGRMYLSPDSSYSTGGTTPATTPLDVFDLSNPAAPRLAGQTQVPGNVWIMIPSGTGTRLFALGSSETQTATTSSSQVALTYVDVSNAAAPTVIGTSAFGEGWASTPATDTFKAFTMDPTRLDATHGLVVLPFSGWDSGKSSYNNGVQLIEYTPSSIMTAGAAHTKGWVERGIFVNNRIVSLSDLALSVVDYTDVTQPKVTAELTLARNVVAAQPSGATIAEISSDWWDNDVTQSDVRVLPTADAEENKDESSALDLPIAGVDAQVFTNGSLDYVVTSVQVDVPCGQPGASGGTAPAPGGSPTKTQTCTGWQQQVQVVDLSNGTAKLRGKIALPMDPGGYYGGWGWSGCYYYDWFDGAPVMQVEGSALAFRRWSPSYAPNGTWIDGASDLLVVDLSKPDAPTVASSVITSDPTGWWGDMTVVGSTLYTSHYEWMEAPVVASADGGNVVQNSQPSTRYYLDRIDLSDRKHPRIGSKINVPGVLVGGSEADPSVLYTIDSNWDASTWRNSFNVVRLHGDRAYLQSRTPLDGWTGRTIVRGSTAYLSTQVYNDRLDGGQAAMELHQIDLSNPAHPVDRVATGKGGWGWLLDVQGDRAMVTSGWGQDGLDVYKLSPSAAPVYDQFVRTRGWSVNAVTRQGTQMFLSSGYWGVQSVTLQ